MGALQKAVVSLIAVGAATMLVPAGAQDYPNRPVRILAGAPGTLTESAARQVGQRLSERSGKPVVVENRATNTIATGAATQAPADGYTLVMSDRTALATFPAFRKRWATIRSRIWCRSRGSPLRRWFWLPIRRCRPRHCASSSNTRRSNRAWSISRLRARLLHRTWRTRC